MQDTELYITDLLTTDATLLALVGDATHISSVYPEKITLFPYIVYREENQIDTKFKDDFPSASISEYIVDIFVKENDTYPIAKAVYDIFFPLNWVCDYSSNVPDPDIRVQHRTMRFSRLLMAGDI